MGNLGNTAKKLEKLLETVPAERKQGFLLSDLLPLDERTEYKAFEQSIAERVDPGAIWPFTRLTNEELRVLRGWVTRMKSLEL